MEQLVNTLAASLEAKLKLFWIIKLSTCDLFDKKLYFLRTQHMLYWLCKMELLLCYFVIDFVIVIEIGDYKGYS